MNDDLSDINDITKRCTKCNEEKPLTEFYKAKKGLWGRRSVCKKCEKLMSIAWQKKNRDRVRATDKRWRDRNKEKIRQKNVRYYRERQEQQKERVRKWREENREKLLAYYRKRWRENKEILRERARTWRKENPDKVRILNQKRRAQMESLPNDLTLDDWNRCLEYFNNCCAYCGRMEELLHQEHVIPISKGGGYTKDNIVPACASCNSSKRNKDFLRWYRQYPLYDEARELKILEYLEMNRVG